MRILPIVIEFGRSVKLHHFLRVSGVKFEIGCLIAQSSRQYAVNLVQRHLVGQPQLKALSMMACCQSAIEPSCLSEKIEICIDMALIHRFNPTTGQQMYN
jgi:hypothetical protein